MGASTERRLSRFYSSAVLDHLHRSQALEEWSKLSKGDSISLEKALGGFDLFVLHDQHGDLQEVSSLLILIFKTNVYPPANLDRFQRFLITL